MCRSVSGDEASIALERVAVESIVFDEREPT